MLFAADLDAADDAGRGGGVDDEMDDNAGLLGRRRLDPSILLFLFRFPLFGVAVVSVDFVVMLLLL